MRMLKPLVVVMGIMLVLGTAALIAAIILRASHRGAAPTDAAPAKAETAPSRGVIALPAGARVVESRLAGGRILLRLALPENGEELIIVDAASGARLATLDLRTEPAK
jgi:hypothetical protein